MRFTRGCWKKRGRKLRCGGGEGRYDHDENRGGISFWGGKKGQEEIMQIRKKRGKKGADRKQMYFALGSAMEGKRPFAGKIAAPPRKGDSPSRKKGLVEGKSYSPDLYSSRRKKGRTTQKVPCWTGVGEIASSRKIAEKKAATRLSGREDSNYGLLNLQKN